MEQLAREVFAEQNKIRANPKSYMVHLEKMLGYFKGNTLHLPGEIPLCTNEGPAAVRDCISFINRQSPLEPLVWNDNMTKAALDHANDIGPKGICGHNGSDGSTMSSRLERYGDWMGKIGENICFGGKTATDIIVQLIIDDGVSSRGHRNNIFNKDYRVTGIAAGKHSQYDICCVLDYASQYNSKGGSGQQQPYQAQSQPYQQQPAFQNFQQKAQPQQQTFQPQQQTFNPQQFNQKQPQQVQQEPLRGFQQEFKVNQQPFQDQFQKFQDFNNGFQQPQKQAGLNYGNYQQQPQQKQPQQQYQYQAQSNQSPGEYKKQFQEQIKNIDNFFANNQPNSTQQQFQTNNQFTNMNQRPQNINQQAGFQFAQQFGQQKTNINNVQAPPGTVKTSTERRTNIVNGVKTTTEKITFYLQNGEIRIQEKTFQE